MMPALTLAAVARTLDAACDAGSVPLSGVVMDSRTVSPGDLFVALRGQRVDGHRYVAAAAAAGAVAAIVEEPVDAAIPCIVVGDTLQALTRLGAANRAAYSGELAAITGSCGKTSVKNMCRAILQRVGATVATAGNYNNEIGVPLTLTRLDGSTRFAVVEMGATQRGDIRHLCALATPRVSTVLNAMEAHLDGFGSVAEVAQVKGEIYDGLPPGGIAVLNIDQSWADLWRQRIAAAGAHELSCSLHSPADITVSALRDLGLEGSVFRLHLGGLSRTLTLRQPGQHSVANALAAAGIASAMGADIDQIAEGLARTEVEPGRLQTVPLDAGRVLIDDSYNANPGSARAAIELLAQAPGPTLLILGEMLELGAQSAARHAEMGALAKQRDIARFIGVGAALLPAVEAFGSTGEWFADRESLIEALPRLLEDAGTILVKGSRGAGMESIQAAIREIAGGADLC
ncbi:MAG: UDP-N-acetylmuramoyl-tripeptide--D-alanyl-D-alanine ligase [Halieaceae bacterium]|jgi:UDP-N-acetylmuramoyl-tripeptide--D-alanyl-D-alanine ligase